MTTIFVNEDQQSTTTFLGHDYHSSSVCAKSAQNNQRRKNSLGAIIHLSNHRLHLVKQAGHIHPEGSPQVEMIDRDVLRSWDSDTITSCERDPPDLGRPKTRTLRTRETKPTRKKPQTSKQDHYSKCMGRCLMSSKAIKATSRCGNFTDKLH